MRSFDRHREFCFAPWPGRTTGYIVDTVQTVFDAFFNTGSFEDCLVNVVNRGGDADTTGALAGQLAARSMVCRRFRRAGSVVSIRP